MASRGMEAWRRATPQERARVMNGLFAKEPAGTVVQVTLPYPPSANRYWRHYRGQTVLSVEAKDYRERVAWLMRGVKPLCGPVRVTLDVYRPAKRGDLDNCAKVLLDAVQGHGYADDSQIVDLHMRRHEDKENPRVEVSITRAVDTP